MRARLLSPWLLALASCSMDNPAFGGSGGMGSETGLDTSSATDPSTLSNSSGQEAPDPVCELGPGVPLEIDLGLGGCTDYTPAFDQFFELVEATGSSLRAYSCTSASDCSTCLNGSNAVATNLNFGPLNLDNIAAPGTCLHVSARRANPSNPDACQYETVVVEALLNQGRVALLVGRNTPTSDLPPIDSNTGLSTFNPMPLDDQICDCAMYPNDCCADAVPTTIKYEIGTGTPVPVGGFGMLPTASGNYKFAALDGYRPGLCGEPTTMAWGLVWQP